MFYALHNSLEGHARAMVSLYAKLVPDVGGRERIRDFKCVFSSVFMKYSLFDECR